MEKETKSLDYINLLYVIGVVLVVLGHSTINYLGNWGMPNVRESGFAVLLNKYIYTFHMPLFFFISGYVFKHNVARGKYKEFPNFVASKFHRLIIPYFVIGFLYVSPFKYLTGEYTTENYIPNVISNLLLGRAPSQLWYLLSLFSVFIIYYHLRKAVDKYQEDRRATLLINCALIGVHIVSHFGVHYFQISNTLNYLVYFHMGYLVCRSNILKKAERNPFKLLLLHAGASGGAALIRSTIIEKTIFTSVGLFFSDFLIACVGVLAYLALAIFLTDKFPSVKNNRPIDVLRRYNLEIYLFHQQIILTMLYSENFRNLHPVLVIILSFSISIALSIVLGMFYKKASRTFQQPKLYKTSKETKSLS